MQAALIAISYMSTYPKLMKRVLRYAISLGHAANNLCRPWKLYGVAQIVKLPLIKQYKVSTFHQLNVKTLFENNINLA
ncbi:hypothetical protein D9M71_488510 [compost metagenome]